MKCYKSFLNKVKTCHFEVESFFLSPAKGKSSVVSLSTLI